MFQPMFDFLLELALEWDDIPSYEHLAPNVVDETDGNPIRWTPDATGSRGRFPTSDELRFPMGMSTKQALGSTFEEMLPQAGIVEALQYDQYGHYVIDQGKVRII